MYAWVRFQIFSLIARLLPRQLRFDLGMHLVTWSLCDYRREFIHWTKEDDWRSTDKPTNVEYTILAEKTAVARERFLFKVNDFERDVKKLANSVSRGG